MKTKIIGILVCTLLITTVLPAMGINLNNHPNEEIISVNSLNGEDIPEPFFVTPIDGDIVYDGSRLWAGEASGIEIMFAGFYYSPYGDEWIEIGYDYDGTEVPAANEEDCDSPWGDGWSVYWDTYGVEGWCYIAVTMWTPMEVWGESIARVYVKETAAPSISEPEYDEVVQDSITLRLTTAGEDVQRVEFQRRRGAPEFSRAENITNLCQFNYCRNINGKNLSGVSCAPTSAASCLKFWNDTGENGKYSNIMKNMTTGKWMTDAELVESLAQKMNIGKKGTSGSNIAQGITEYLNEHGVGPAQPNKLVVHTIGGVSSYNNTTGEPVGRGDMDFAKYKEELEAKNEDVLWGFIWYEKNATTGKYERAGGHIVVGTKVSNTPGNDNKGAYHNVTFMNVACGYNMTVRMRTNGSFIHPGGIWCHPGLMVTVSENETHNQLSLDDGWTTIATDTNPSGGWTGTWDTTTVSDGVYFIRALVIDASGNQGKDTIVVHVKNGGENTPPNKPNPPSGPTSGKINVEHTYTASTTDPDGNTISYLFDWGDGTTSTWTDPIDSGQTATALHTWTTKGTYQIKVKARDIPGFEESDWSEPLSVSMPKNKPLNNPLFLQFLQNHPLIYQLLQRLLKL